MSVKSTALLFVVTFCLSFALLSPLAHADKSQKHKHYHKHTKKKKHSHKHKHRHHGAHEHGVGKLQFVLNGNSLIATVMVPGSDIVGFEYAAKSEKDRKKVDAAKAKIKASKDLIAVNDAGKCEFATGKVAIRQDGDHNEWKLRLSAQCQAPTEINELNTSALLGAFPNIKKLKVEAVSDSKQFSGNVTKKNANIKLW